MSLKTLIDRINSQNIVDEIDSQELGFLATRVIRQHDEDLDSMTDWMKMVKEGLDLMKQEYEPKSFPWENASNYKSPILTEASIQFGNKAKMELLRGDKLVKSAVIGRDDEQQTKKKRGERVCEAMNYQINYQMVDWREDHKRLLYTLPNVGCVFKKTDFNPLEMRNESSLIQYPNFVVNQATTSMEKCRSFTIIRDFSRDQVVSRVNAGIWSETALEIYAKETDGDEGSNEQRQVIDTDGNPDKFYEQYTFADLDGDGQEEPYIVTIHVSSNRIVRIVPRWDLASLIVSRNNRVMRLNRMVIEDTAMAVSNGTTPPDSPDLTGVKLVRVDPIINITKYEFIPSPDSTFLGMGYAHLIGAITQAVNSTTNNLMDSGTLRNLGGGFLAKGARKKMGPLRIKPGEWTSTEISADMLAKGFFPNPQPEPSQVLFALNEKLEAKAASFVATTDASGQIQANTAPTTALAIIQENLVATSALMSSILDSTAKEFQVMYRLNQNFFDPELYKEILADPQASSFADFNTETIDIKTVASAEMASKTQRIQLATVELEQFERVLQVGGNAKLLLRNFFEAIGTQDVDRIFDESTMTEEEKQQIAQLQQQQETLAKQQEEQLNLTRAQVALAQGELERLNFRTSAEVDKLIAEVDKLEVETNKLGSDIILNLEKAETESVKNGIQQYSALIGSLVDATSKMRDINETREAQANAFIAPNQSRSI